MSLLVEYTDPVWRGLNMRTLNVNEAFVIVKNLYKNTTYLYSLDENCYTCPYTKLLSLNPNKSLNFSVNVAYNRKFALYDEDVGEIVLNNASPISTLDSKWNEFGVYNLTINNHGQLECIIDKEPVNIYIPMMTISILLVLCLTVLKIGLCAWRTFSYETIINSPAFVKATTIQRNRLRSLDIFRGLAIMLMIFVNSGGGGYIQLEHATWNGLHLADVIFPCFLWIMGVCIPISVKSQLSKGSTKVQLCGRILWRSFKLFVIGLCLNSIHGPQLENLRIMGVLQRLSISYLICGICHTLSTSKVPHLELQVGWKHLINELRLMKIELLLIFIITVVHLAVLFGLSVPNCPRGYLGPGGLHANASYPYCVGGATGYIDKTILGDQHLYQHPTAKLVYKSSAFDPEGICGCLLTVVQVFFGVLGGIIILNNLEWKSRLLKWLNCSVCLALCAGFLCNFSQEDGVIPLNKNLWSLSYVCLTTAIAFGTLSFLYYIIDVKQWWDGYPFEASGMNTIIIYIGHMVFYKMLPWHWRIGPMNTHFVLMLEALWNTILWLLIALYLHNKKLYYNL